MGKKFRTGTVLITLIMALSFYSTVFAAFKYEHDPMENPKAAQDIVVDPNAVYGYAPNPNSTRLKEYASYDWSDQKAVEEMKKQREEYHDSMKELYGMIKAMKSEGKGIEEIARAVSTRRNEIRLEAYKGDPEGLAKVKKSNLDKFGNENGGTPDYFYDKYGDWETVLEKALSANAGADACLGLYDKYYDTYSISIVERDLPKEINAGGIIGFIIWSICALIMIGIGVWSWRSQKAVGFFTGVKAPEVKDVVKYNHSVAILWFAYGILFEAFGVPLLFFKQNSGEFVITFFGTILSTLALVIGYTVILKKHQRQA